MSSPDRNTSRPESSQQPSPMEGDEIRRCWICQQDENEDVENSVWLKPCPCSLVAHEECLLEWIADEEQPKSGELAVAHQIKCPQCKADIRIDRPRDWIVGLYDRIQGFSRALILPSAVSALVGCTYSGFFVYGLNTITVVFGPEMAEQIILSAVRAPSRFATTSWPRFARDVLLMAERGLLASDPFIPGAYTSWKLGVGLPLIGPALILLRTRVSEFLFPLLAPLYFITPSHQDVFNWPPTPGLTFAIIPYLRVAYSNLYRYAFQDLEKKWDLAVQRAPREGETAEQIAEDRLNGGAEAEGLGNAIIEIEIGDDFLGNAQRPAAPQRVDAVQLADAHAGRMRDFALRQVEREEADLAQAAPIQNAEPAQNRQVNRNWQRDINLFDAATTAMGALAFPVISSLMGDFLNFVLPARLVGRGFYMKIGPKGLLKERWGRTIVGGCLFVVLKDVVTLYCKWKKAKDFGKKKIIEYVKPGEVH
ncbi:putative RING finger protein [Lachnellula arida]|uniref:Putative RING finger protein n=1 Tax=Lachnellula arida TaxID=1316785 RepID=A0A8T9B6R4_9HELO|nr:putative RING finger protein [Lachnellula arida]